MHLQKAPIQNCGPSLKLDADVSSYSAELFKINQKIRRKSADGDAFINKRINQGESNAVQKINRHPGKFLHLIDSGQS